MDILHINEHGLTLNVARMILVTFSLTDSLNMSASIGMTLYLKDYKISKMNNIIISSARTINRNIALLIVAPGIIDNER